MPKHSSIYLERVHPIIVKPLVAAVIGLNESIVIQQVHYWLQRSTNIREDRQWIYNTYGEWAEQFPFWSESTIGRIFRRLEDDGLILARQFNAAKYDHTKWYTIDYEKLDATLESSGIFDDSNLTPSEDVKLEPSDDVKLTSSTLDRDYQETTTDSGADAPKPKANSNHPQWSPIWEAIVEVTGVDTSMRVNASNVAGATKQIIASPVGYTVDDVLFSPVWWKSQDFPGRVTVNGLVKWLQDIRAARLKKGRSSRGGAAYVPDHVTPIDPSQLDQFRNPIREAAHD